MLKKFRAYARSFFQDKMIYTEKTIEQIDRRLRTKRIDYRRYQRAAGCRTRSL